MNTRVLDAESPYVDTIEMEHRQRGGKTSRGAAVGLLEYFAHAQRPRAFIVRVARPAVEVARHDQRRFVRYQPLDAHRERAHLAAAVMRHQAQVHAYAMQCGVP